MDKKDRLKLIYVYKVGTSTKGQSIYEFIFSETPDQIKEKEWGWDAFPARQNAMAPDEDHETVSYEFKTDLFELKCLHELNDRTYLDGYYKIHAIAYENEEYKNPYGIEFNDVLVFHYGNSLKEVEAKMYKRDIFVDHKTHQFVAARNVKLKKKAEENDLIF